MRKNVARALGASLMVVATYASAEPYAAVVVTDITGTISNQLASMSAIQIAMLTAMAVLVAFGLIRRAMR